MTGLLAIGLANALTALVAALVVSIVARFLERPALVHAMWLLVLLELLAPPVFEIDMLPGALRAVPSVATFVVADAGAPTGAETPAGARATVAPERVATPPAGVETDLLGWAIAAWLAGAAVVIGLALVRVVRLHRRLRGPARAPRRLRRRLDRLAREMGLGRPPALRIVRSHLSPCVWLRPGGSELLFPAALLGRLTPRETDALLAHELAHLLRRDHWVRYVELSATALFWWHPVAWWARARLRRAEESCCDQIVLRTFADPRAYARALIETVEYLVDTGRPVPALASGVGEARQMEERLTMIMNERPPSRPSRTVRLVLAVVALALLLVFPTWSDRAAAAGEGRAPVGSPIDENESELRESMLELERLALDLERQLREIRGRQNELNLELERHRVARGIDELESGAESIDDGSREARERLLFERLDQIERQTSLTARALELERAELEQTAELELALRRRMLDVERSQGAGDRRAAERMAAAALELERRIESSARELDERRLQLQQEELDAQAEAMRAEIDLLREQGRRIEADELERELDRRWVIESERRGAGRVEERARVEAALAELTELARRLEREGRERELREVEKQIETLRRQIEAGSGEPY